MCPTITLAMPKMIDVNNHASVINTRNTCLLFIRQLYGSCSESDTRSVPIIINNVKPSPEKLLLKTHQIMIIAHKTPVATMTTLK